MGFRSRLRLCVFGETDPGLEDRELGTSLLEGLGLILGSEGHRPPWRVVRQGTVHGGAVTDFWANEEHKAVFFV